MTRIAIVGMACEYPDAGSPARLWENVLAGRRAFRRLPDVRVRLADYYDPDPAAPDRFNTATAAVIEGYEFDRVGYRIAGSTYRSTDLTHWLALDVAARALADAGFPGGTGLPAARTGVVVGNSLTGEFSRANGLRLRWPYVRRVLADVLGDALDGTRDGLAALLETIEARYKQPFPPIDEDSLAGALANTIAGRICNYFDFGGGGYTVDGACSSSLLSVITAARALAADELDVAVAGGVDLSIDPFELVGFAKTGALAADEMLVYDQNSGGFWPGEGCGMLVLMRAADARAAGYRSYATIAGWGVSSDGRGGLTRPELAGYRLALDRAYQRSGFGIETVDLFEGHGTGTAVGDANELAALSGARRDAGIGAPPAALGSVKAMIGHTKAAAGVAGLIKATLAVHHRTLPPTVGCRTPHRELATADAPLRVLDTALPWPDGRAVRAGVTAMGFGGINSHVTIEGVAGRAAQPVPEAAAITVRSHWRDPELLLLSATSTDTLAERLAGLAATVAAVSGAELGDLAAELAGQPAAGAWRAAVVADSPEGAAAGLGRARTTLLAGTHELSDAASGVFLGQVSGPARIGLLFPGQGGAAGTGTSALGRRFPELVPMPAAGPVGVDPADTRVVQPRIVAGSVAALHVLSHFGVDARLALGHSLGELTALHWAGALDEATALRLARVRGALMAEHSLPGAMSGLGAPEELAETLIAGDEAVVACVNGPRQTVVAGTPEAVRRVGERARARGIACAPLPVSLAFHSPLVAPSAEHFARALGTERIGRPDRAVISTVTGDRLAPDTDLVALLHRQITAPVRFAAAVRVAAEQVDLFVEAGPGQMLAGMVRQLTEVPVVPLDTDSPSLAGLLRVLGAAWVKGAAVQPDRLWHGRIRRPFALDRPRRFFANPCEAAPVDTAPRSAPVNPLRTAVPPVPAPDPAAVDLTDAESADTVRRLIARRVELPVSAVRMDSLLLDDLHLSSITIGNIVADAAQALGMPVPQAPTGFATATVGDLIEALDTLRGTALPGDGVVSPVLGAAPWIRAFHVDLDRVGSVPAGAPAVADAGGDWVVHPAADPFAEPLRRALSGAGAGVLVHLRPGAALSDVEMALDAAKAAAGGQRRFVLVQHGDGPYTPGAAGLARCLHLEYPALRTTVVHLPERIDATAAAAVVAAEVRATTGFTEVFHDGAGGRFLPTLRALPPLPAAGDLGLSPTDVLLVVGGGKGITAECALALGARTGSALAILGRSAPDDDPALRENLERMRDAGVRVHYVRADLTDAAAVGAAVAEVTRLVGPVTGLLHGAGRNEPAALRDLDSTALRDACAPKVAGLRTVLDALDPARLRLLVAFGSVIARSGLRGEAHYAVANEWLAAVAADHGKRNPHCRTLCVEWSVWSGVGMGERLSAVEALARDGITPITTDEGVEALVRLLALPGSPATVVVAGRLGGLDTLRLEQPALPLLRFVDRVLSHQHGVELVSEVELSRGTDRYLDDHCYDGNLLFPAVFGLEAMAQVACAVTGCEAVPDFTDVEFSRPIVVPFDGSATVRIAATVVGAGRVAVVIRTADTGYSVDHFRATVCLPDSAADPRPDGTARREAMRREAPAPAAGTLPPVRLDPRAELYGSTLFQGKRFQRLLRYHTVAARRVDAEVSTAEPPDWFSAFLPDRLLLGDPGMRDALLHGNQVCVPGMTLLPVAVRHIWPSGPRPVDETRLSVTALEREQHGDTYVYDIAVRDGAGEVVEAWVGLALRAVRSVAGPGDLPAPLLGPLVQREVEVRTGRSIAVAVQPDEDRSRRANTALALARASGGPVAVRYRPDGRPELDGYLASAAHGAGLTVAVTAPASAGMVACDVELVTARGAAWAGLLGRYQAVADAVASSTGEAADVAGTRVWAALECLTKAGVNRATPLTVVAGTGTTPWLEFAAGRQRIATVVVSLPGVGDSAVFAVLTGEGAGG